MGKKRFFTCVALLALFQPVWGQKVEEIDQRLKVLERLQELKQEEDAKKAAEGAKVRANAKDGFSIRANDGSFALRIGGYFQLDGRHFSHDRQFRGTDAFLNRRTRLDFRGTVSNNFDFRIQTALDGGTASLQDGTLDVKFGKGLNLRAGKTKAPVGLERLQSNSDTVFVETGLPTGLTPNYDLGLFLFGELAGGRLAYNLALLDGAADNASLDTDSNESKEGAGRIFLTPFVNGWSFLKGLGIGIGGTHGHQDGAAYVASYRTPGQATAFSYNTTVQAHGVHYRVAPQGYFYRGSFGAYGEYTRSSQDLINNTNLNAAQQVYRIDHQAWQLAASYVIGGQPSYKGVAPKSNFDPAKGAWGAFELGARWNVFLADIESFERGLVAASTPRRLDSLGGVGNWHFAKGVKLQLGYDLTDFQGQSTAPAHNTRLTERFISSRFQVAF